MEPVAAQVNLVMRVSGLLTSTQKSEISAFDGIY